MGGIGISAQTFDLDGARYFKPSDLASNTPFGANSASRRVSRTATLDGGASIYDAGYVVADRTISIRIETVTLAIMEFVRHVCQSYSLITVTTEEAAFSVVPEAFNANSDGSISMSMLVIEKLS